MAVSTRCPYERGRSTVHHSRSGLDIKRIDLGISGSTAALPAYLPSYVLLWKQPTEICYHNYCSTRLRDYLPYLTMALSDEDDGVDLFNGY